MKSSSVSKYRNILEQQVDYCYLRDDQEYFLVCSCVGLEGLYFNTSIYKETGQTFVNPKKQNYFARIKNQIQKSDFLDAVNFYQKLHQINTNIKPTRPRRTDLSFEQPSVFNFSRSISQNQSLLMSLLQDDYE